MTREEEEARPGEVRDFEDVLERVGGWSAYQALVFSTFLLVCSMFAFLSYTPALFLYVPEHWCRIEAWEEEEPRPLGSHGLKNKEILLDLLIPKDDNGRRSGCEMYRVPQEQILLLNNGVDVDRTNWTTKACTNGWEYNTTGLFASAVTDMDWVCEDEYKGPLTQFVFYLGSIVGSLLFGYTGDKYGRLNTMLATSTLMFAGGTALPFCPNLASFAAVRFIMGLTFPASLMNFFMLCLEFVTADKRSLIGNLGLAAGFTLGGCVEAWILKWMGDWKMFHAVIFAPAVVLIAARWYLNESVIWLITVGKIDQAMSAVKRTAKINRRNLDKNIIEEIKIFAQDEYKKSRQDKSQGKDVTDLFKTPGMRRITCLTTLTWMFIFSLFLGHVLNQGNIKGDIYVSFTISSGLELPADFLAILILDRLGRRWTCSTGLVLSGLTMLASGLLLATVLAMLGRFFIMVALNSGQQLMLEVFPTELRAQGTAVTTSMGQVASLASPYFAHSSKVFKPLPFLLMGGLGLLGGALPLFLPETAGVPLPNTVREAEDLARESKFFSMPILEARKRKTPDENANQEDGSKDASALLNAVRELINHHKELLR